MPKMENESLFLTSEQVLKAVCLDFRGYGPQPMLFCEVLRAIFGDDVAYRRETGKDGLWISMAGQHRMRWLEGVELIEFMCKAVTEARLTEDVLASICRRVFQTPCQPETCAGLSGIRVQMDMESFSCHQCGRCCSQLDYHDGITAEDMKRLKELGREDVLKWVGVSKTSAGQTGYRMWLRPGTNAYAHPCPFLKQGPTNEQRLCAIHDVKPQICRNYPVSRKHALMTGCPGFVK